MEKRRKKRKRDRIDLKPIHHPVASKAWSRMNSNRHFLTQNLCNPANVWKIAAGRNYKWNMWTFPFVRLIVSDVMKQEGRRAGSEDASAILILSRLSIAGEGTFPIESLSRRAQML